MFFWQTRPCLHLVVNPLYLPSWSLLLILDFNSDTSTSWRVFFTWLDVVKGFFFTMERILRSFPTVVLRGSPGFFITAELTSAFFFFSESTKLLIWPLHTFLLSLWWICFVFEAYCFTSMESSFESTVWVQSNSFQMQMEHLELTLDLLPA